MMCPCCQYVWFSKHVSFQFPATQKHRHIYTHTHTHIHTYIHTYENMVCTYIDVCVCLRMCISVYLHMHICNVELFKYGLSMLLCRKLLELANPLQEVIYFSAI